MKNLGALLLLPMLLATCAGSDEPFKSDIPVIEGYIDADGYPVVMFTSAIVPDNGGGELADKMIRWGRVSISDGSREVILTGKRDDSCFPPYKYFSYDIKGVPGKTYTLTADFKDMHARAECVMLSPVQIQSITFAPIEGNDTLRSAMLHFVAPDDVPAYFYITLDGAPALMGWVEATEPGVEISVPVYNSKSFSESGQPFAAQLKVGETHAVALHRVPERVYRFWRAYDEVAMFGGNVLFGATASLPTNIAGGLGIFAARATSSRSITVE